MRNYETNPRLAKMKSTLRPYENRETNPIHGFVHESQTIFNSGFMRIDAEIGSTKTKPTTAALEAIGVSALAAIFWFR
jgi:hypothetical protein